ncbi:MAG: hypothetical protein ACOC7S_02480 [Planctomycetota bacterium]
MAITVEEKAESRESTTGDGASVELQHVIRGTASDLEAKAALGDAAPVLYDGLPRESRRGSPIFVDIGNRCKRTSLLRQASATGTSCGATSAR